MSVSELHEHQNAPLVEVRRGPSVARGSGQCKARIMVLRLCEAKIMADLDVVSVYWWSDIGEKKAKKG